MGNHSANRAEHNPKNKPRKRAKCHDQESNEPQKMQCISIMFEKTSQCSLHVDI